MNEYEFIPFDEKCTPYLSFYILYEKCRLNKNVVLVVDDNADFYKIKHTFLEIQKIVPQIVNFHPQNKNFFIFLSENKISYESIIDIINLSNDFNNREKFFIAIQQSLKGLKIISNLKPYNLLNNEYIDLKSLIDTLIKFGYTRKDFVESIGEFSLRGEILDLWFNGFLYDENNNFLNKTTTVRIILDDNKIKDIRQFDVSSQRSFILQQKISVLKIYPVNFQNFELSYNIDIFFSENSLIINFLSNQKDFLTDLLKAYHRTTKYFGNIDICKKDFKNFILQKYNIFLGYAHNYEYQKLKETFSEFTNINYIKTELTEGFYNSKEKFLFTTYFEIFTKYDYYHHYKEKSYHGIRLEGIWDIKPQDYVVHADFGIAKFLGIQKLNFSDKKNEFLVLIFQNNTKLYVPINEFDKVEKYISLTNRPPKLSCLDNSLWQRTKNKVKESLKEFITQLYQIYTQRKNLKGISHISDEELEKMLEESFEYEETDDQLKAIDDVFKDMTSNYPMDRIIVGDVGFGKTEVAIRAAFKCVLSGRQVLLLCPTTILAEQHYRSFFDRLEPFGVKIGVITRLQSKSYIESTLKKLEEGNIDIIIGTHILLNDKIKFFDLGLVIIDEEHKFGVKQKEKIRLKYRVNDFKQNIENVLPDILSLTATPIPRTLAFGLEGIKDISLIETPPEGRVPIETFVLPYDIERVIYAINRELLRDGQVYYVFNDISLIQNKFNQIKKFFPNIEIEFIHSKLPAKKIEEVMMRFMNKEIKVLLTTSIIESGLDIPSVNTIIIENAERFGLAQLYQLRGRVGRRSIKAYCYFLYSKDNMTSNAKKRLSALIEFSFLGSGYKLALRDLEIRGAGEVLGTKQHGFVNDIGLSMYSKIMQQLISEIKTQVSYQEISPKIELDIEAYIPDEYILSSDIKVVFYRKLLQAENIDTIESIKDEMEDRFGKISKYEQLKNLFLLCKLRIYLKKYKIIRLYDKREKNINLFFEFLDTNSKQNLFSLWKNNFCNINIYKEKENFLKVEIEDFSLEKILSMFQI